MKQNETFSTLDADQLMEINGGGFAYDLGRILRFIGLSGGSGSMIYQALVDWYVTDAINDAANP